MHLIYKIPNSITQKLQIHKKKHNLHYKHNETIVFHSSDTKTFQNRTRFFLSRNEKKTAKEDVTNSFNTLSNKR